MSAKSRINLIGWARFFLPPVLLVFLAWHFYRSFKSIESPEIASLVLSVPAWSWGSCAALYLAGILCSAMFWRILLVACGYTAPLSRSCRAFLVSQMGKYVPGKGLALLMRAAMVRDYGVPMTIGVATGMIEVLWTMAVGALLALAIALCLEFFGLPGLSTDRWLIPKLGFLAVVTLVPAWPSWSIRLARASARRMGFDTGMEQFRLPAARLAFGALLMVAGWILLSLSLVVLVEGLAPGAGLKILAPSTAWVPLANVGGFVASTPGGLGVREFLIQQSLTPQLGSEQALVVSLLLRLVWTVAEVASALVMWFWWTGKPASTTSGAPE
ncbi:MAG: lysylphosphatidylglycerol synthase domain-containing protein [Planctomycetota bacterium]|jgi:uncharacterized membrane protein YbhN (UPF0104 family)